MSDSRWYFTEEQLANSPSRKCGMNAEQELSYRQRAANLIQEMGQRLQVSQLCINTAIVYMHRFYAFHSFTMFHRDSIAAAAFFLAAKVEEQPRKLEHVIKILNICLEKTDITREMYAEQAQELVFNENVLLQTLGFDVAIDHPHTYVVKACQLFNIVTVSRELRQTCYFMASNSLHLTTMCLKYRPTVVAAFCIYIACTWSGWKIPDSSEGLPWYSYVDKSVTPDILKKLTDEYLQILEKSPSKFKSKMKAITNNGQALASQNSTLTARDDGPSTSSYHKTQHHEKPRHHHHNRHHTSSTSSSTNVNRKQGSEETTVNLSATSTKPTPQQMPSQVQSGSGYKNQQQPPLTVVGGASGSSSNVQRPRPSSSQQPYSGSNQKTGVSDERPQQRQMHQENAYNNTSSSSSSRPSDPNKQRINSAQPPLPSSSQQQPPLPPSSNVKPTTNFDQRHSMSANLKQPLDHQQKPMKHPTGGSNTDYQNRTSSQSQQSTHKKPTTWSQQQQQSSSSSSSQNVQKPSHNQSGHVVSSASTNKNGQGSLPQYSEATKQSSSSSFKPDYWLGRPNQQQQAKPLSPPRQAKSMFSPSPEHDVYDKTKFMMMANIKRSNENSKNDSPKSEKSQERRSLTPSKREKRTELASSSSLSQMSSSQIDSKLMIKTEPQIPSLISDAGVQHQQKRPFSSIDDDDALTSDSKRDVKMIKLEPTKSGAGISRPKPSHISDLSEMISHSVPSMKQPIETNPDIVKSLLQECYASSKFDSLGMDSPLDVINPEPPEQLLAGPPTILSTTQQSQSKSIISDSLIESTLNDSAKDNGTDDDRQKKNKSKKKKEKHKHKDRSKDKEHKEHKKHKKDRHKDREDTLKIIVQMPKPDRTSSPESLNASAFKIKLPINPEMSTGQSLTNLPPSSKTAPLKLKISKFNSSSQSQSVNDGSHHKKKDKDKPHKKSKHGNNNSDAGNDMIPDQSIQQSYPSQQPQQIQQQQQQIQQQQPIGKIQQQQQPPQQQQPLLYQAPEQMNSMSFNQQPPLANQDHHGAFMNPMMQQHFQNMFNSFNSYQQQQAVSYNNKNANRASSGNKK